MKRLVLAVLAIIFVSTGSAGAQSANNFTINSFDATYTLSRGEDQRSRLAITETIVAEFPNRDQNHGIERALPKKYNDHTLRLKIASIKDQNGKNWKYETSSQNSNEVLRIGDPDKYVRGTQTYIISYVYHDVVVNNQWRWNTNGLQWQQPFKALNATVRLEGDLAHAVTNRSCVYGSASAETPCTITGDTFSVSEALKPNQNLTFQLDFKEGTFANYQDPALVAVIKKAQFVLLAALIIGLVALAWFSYRTHRRFSRRVGARGVTVPEYLPPKQASVTQSAVVTGKAVGVTSTAQILDLAVRHYVKLYELEKTGLISKKSNYKLELIKPVGDLQPDEQSFVVAVFGSADVGATVEIKESNTSLVTALQKQFTATQKETHASALYVHGVKKGTYYALYAAVTAIWIALAIASFSFYNYAPAQSLVGGLLAILGAVYAFVMIFVVLGTKQLSKPGTELYEYLAGLEEYMKIAEAERLTVLQSPQGAIKTPVDTSDSAQLVKLYERVLPYAVLMGVEKDWSKQMELYYANTNSSPDWYSGTSAFHAGVFAASLSDFSSSMNSYSSPSSSSSSSGSGSGGGGGGGGGW